MPRPCKHAPARPGCRVCTLASEATVRGARYRKLWGEARPGDAALLAPPRPKPPSLLARAVNLAGAVASHVAAGLPTVDDATHARRLAACLGCEKRYGQDAAPGCTICGCNLKAKARWAEQKCPHPGGDRWAAPPRPAPLPPAPPAAPVHPWQADTPCAMAERIRGKVGGWPEGWAGWAVTREAHLSLMRERVAAGPAHAPGSGRGVVTCVSARSGFSSGKDLEHGYLPAAWAAHRELRRLGCTLPAAWAYLGDEEMDPHLLRLAARLGASGLDLRRAEAADPRRPRILAGWESKCYAVLRAPFRECLYLDADNVPINDPTPLFDAAEYRACGAAFWPDVPPSARPEWLPAAAWRNAGLEPRPGARAFESGQFVVDRARRAAELDLAMWFNEHSDWVYQFVFGDKDTFLLAWEVLGTPYAMPARGPRGTGASLIQHGFGGEPLFNHGTRNKPTLSGYPRPEKLHAQREACEGHLKELAGLWGGRLWQHTAPLPEEEALAGRLAGTYRYERGGEARTLELRPGGLAGGPVGEGAAGREASWAAWLEEGGVEVLAVSGSDGRPTMTLRRDAGGAWRGRWLGWDRGEAALLPREGGA